MRSVIAGCLVKDAESLSSDDPKTNRLITRKIYHTISRPLASRANGYVSLLPLHPPPELLRHPYLPCSSRQQVHGHNAPHPPPRSRKPHPSSLCLPRRWIMRAKKSVVRTFSWTQVNFSRFKPSLGQTILARSRGCFGAW